MDILVELVFWLVVEILFWGTGELILFLVSFGRRKPRWGLYKREQPARSIFLFELSFWVGAFFWGFVVFVVLVVLKLFGYI